MQWIAAQGIATQPGNNHGTDVTPGTLVDRLMGRHILSFLMAIGRAVGRKANTLGTVPSAIPQGPTIIRIFNLNLGPELLIFNLVFQIQVVDIESTDVREDLLHAEITPVRL